MYSIFLLTTGITTSASAEVIVWPLNTVTVLPGGIAVLVHLVLHLQRVGEVELGRLWHPVRHAVTTELPVEHVLGPAIKQIQDGQNLAEILKVIEILRGKFGNIIIFSVAEPI